jgi:hypothetical protein
MEQPMSSAAAHSTPDPDVQELLAQQAEYTRRRAEADERNRRRREIGRLFEDIENCNGHDGESEAEFQARWAPYFVKLTLIGPALARCIDRLLADADPSQGPALRLAAKPYLRGAGDDLPGVIAALDRCYEVTASGNGGVCDWLRTDIAKKVWPLLVEELGLAEPPTPDLLPTGNRPGSTEAAAEVGADAQSVPIPEQDAPLAERVAFMRLPLKDILEQIDIEVRAARADRPPYDLAKHLRRLVFEAYETWNNFVAFDCGIIPPAIEDEASAKTAIWDLQQRLAELARPTTAADAPKIAFAITVPPGQNGNVTIDFQRAEHGARFRLGKPGQAEYIDLWRYEGRYFLRNPAALHDRTPPAARDFVTNEQAEAWLQNNPFARLRALCINFDFIYQALKATSVGEGIRGSCALDEIRGLTRRIVSEGRATSLPSGAIRPDAEEMRAEAAETFAWCNENDTLPVPADLLDAASPDDAGSEVPVGVDVTTELSPLGPKGSPKTLLTGWHEITANLKMKYSDAAKVKSLNLRLGGPIQNRGKGTHPMVYREDLLAWWDTMALAHQALVNESVGAKLSAEAHRNYGRKGAVAPEIAGGVKNRRKDRQA